MDGTDNIIVLADMADIQRLNGWEKDEVSTLEISLAPYSRNAAGMRRATDQIGMIALEDAGADDDTLVATSVMTRYPQIFDWLNLIDFNVVFILILMTIVAGFNMISGLLIMLFRNISTIGTLKSLGMTDRSIAKVFLKVASVIVLKGMLAGNVLALLFCGIQKWTHVLKLNPENYFVPFVPVHLNLPVVLQLTCCHSWSSCCCFSSPACSSPGSIPLRPSGLSRTVTAALSAGIVFSTESRTSL